MCSENKDADQLRGYREADLRLCFRIYKNPVFSRRGSNAILSLEIFLFLIFKPVMKFCSINGAENVNRFLLE